MKFLCAVLVLLLTTSCATALKREGQCLASLTPDFLQAQEELASLEASWRRAMVRRDVELNRAQPRLAAASDPRGEAYRKLIDAKSRHQTLFVWYDKVYERVRTRMDEEEILSDVRLVLITNPGVIFYPLIRWNIHSVFWDGTDPDAESDPVTHYCAARLAQMAAITEPTPRYVE